MYDRQDNISLLTDRMQERAKNFMLEAKKITQEYTNWDVDIFETLRTQERQYFLAGKGRTQSQLKAWGVPSAFLSLANPSDTKRTWTLQSNHKDGNAFDIAFTFKNQWTWSNIPSGLQKKLADLAPSYGLRNLAPLEYAHFEDNEKNWKPTILQNNMATKAKIEADKLQAEIDKKHKISIQASCSSLWYSASPELRELLSETHDKFN